jgi:Reverse transcriptase (RNA-dependent DNA polymerase)
MDYYEITSPMVKFDSLQLLLAVGNALDWEIEMMDVKGAFLNSKLEEEIYMRQPEGFDDGTGHVLKLRRALYRLKQAGRTWHQQLRNTLLSFGYTQSTADECIYIRTSKSGMEAISVYVDDLGLFASSKEGMSRIKGELNERFAMTDLGEMKKILGLRVERNCEEGTLKILQGLYIDIVLARFHMQDANPVSTPLSKTVKLTPTNEAAHTRNDIPYATAIGSLMYTALGMRPDLAFTVQHLSQFTTSYGQEHWTAIKHALRYLKGTRDCGIIFKRGAGLDLELFVDSDYANHADAISISGYVAMIGGGCIAWSSKKQRTIALSTTEAEYIALTEGAKQLVWLRRFLQDLSFEQSKSTSIRSDNLSAITISHDATYHARTKHINVTYHFICEKVASNEATLTYIQSKENPVDLMTKGLELNQHRYLRAKLGYLDLSI